jgi:hypothetical protein
MSLQQHPCASFNAEPNVHLPTKVQFQSQVILDLAIYISSILDELSFCSVFAPVVL